MFIQELETFDLSASTYFTKEQLNKYIYDLNLKYLNKGKNDILNLKTKQDVIYRQKLIRNSFIKSIGGLPSKKTPLNVKKTGELKFDNFSIEKIIYESQPDFFVTANLYIPTNISQPTGAVLFLNGHSEEAKACIAYQRVCQYLTQAGFIVLNIDPV